MGAVAGVGLAPKGAAVELATVTLHRAADSVVVKNEFSDPSCRFRFEEVGIGRYLVPAAQLGFGRAWCTPLEAQVQARNETSTLRRAASAAMFKLSATSTYDNCVESL
ncbi:carboxypeptidase regulatory-like domain-containing protein [Hymenobacter busanensis]|uniref:carboxypeptidase regulatory-like domain-containing protein n=1 Tax=Hymenobacter busanensis TaxID=2607656 RepID=UPI00141F91B3|nr:carboxypeptidase regulatory-like domain-containing protein [Hymenobacter busanensis]